MTDDPMPVFVIKGKDQLALSAINFYRQLCENNGLHDQAAEVGKAWHEMLAWQRRQPPGVMQFPDHPHVPARSEASDG